MLDPNDCSVAANPIPNLNNAQTEFPIRFSQEPHSSHFRYAASMYNVGLNDVIVFKHSVISEHCAPPARGSIECKRADLLSCLQDSTALILCSSAQTDVPKHGTSVAYNFLNITGFYILA